MKQFDTWDFVLGSSSPRRQDLLGRLGLEFEIRTVDFDERISEDIALSEQPEILALRKSNQIELNSNRECLITSDTSVIFRNEILNKPQNKAEAMQMLSSLNGNWHEVVTGVCLRTAEGVLSFSESTQVHFRTMGQEFIEDYIDDYQPYDKAGSYGIQELFGYIVVDKIEGCYFNVMGLPLSRLYLEMEKFLGAQSGSQQS